MTEMNSVEKRGKTRAIKLIYVTARTRDRFDTFSIVALCSVNNGRPSVRVESGGIRSVLKKHLGDLCVAIKSCKMDGLTSCRILHERSKSHADKMTTSGLKEQQRVHDGDSREELDANTSDSFAIMKKQKAAKKVKLPPHIKYPRYMSAEEERQAHLYKPTPSMLTQELSTASSDQGLGGGRRNRFPVPEIVEFIKDPNAEGCTVPLDEPIFQPYPLHMQFKDYTEYGVYRQTLYFRNNDSVPRRMRVEALDGPNFSVRPNPRANDRIAPGMEVSFEVTFKPHGKRDYREKLVCVTEREKFLVEISALGPWACMDFPDEIGFGTCPVNHENERTFLVRNIGERDTRFALRATEPFDVRPRAGFLAMHESVQVTVTFNSDYCAEFDGEMEVAYENGQASYVHVHGSTESINVSIDKPVAEVDPAYISLMSTCTVLISNDSDIPVDFEWKSFATALEDGNEKTRLLQELDRLEAIEAATANPILLKQKYRHLRRAVEDDAMLFADENFRIEPLTGQVWSHSAKEVTISFSPLIAADYASIACLAVTGRENRIPLKILGQGIGPKAAFSAAIVDFGTVFIGSEHTHSIEIENRGDIRCEYLLDAPSEDLASALTFSPSMGTLEVGETRKLQIDFCSGKLGAFSEIITFSMTGSNDKLRVRVKGNVVGPTFDVNVAEFAFGRIAYGFANTREFVISNTSEIPMEFALRVPGDGKFDEPEFVVTPSAGTIEAGQEQNVTLTFTSRTVTRYQMDLVIDVINIGQAQRTIPIQAECAVAAVGVHAGAPLEAPQDGFQAVIPDGEDYGGSDSSREGDLHLEFGPCFLRYPYTRQLLLRNTSDVRARFEIVPQDEATLPLASYEPSEMIGTIEPMSEHRVDVTMRVEKLGKFSLPLLVRIQGSDKPPLMVDVAAHGCGPRIVVEPSLEIDFDTVTCLTTAKRSFRMHNRSLIAAPYANFLKDSKSKFTLDCAEGCLGPGEDIECTVSVCPDDASTHRDELHIVVTEGESIVMQLKAKGTGTTMFCKELKELQVCNFGNVFTNRVHEKKFLLENRGRREQTLSWTNLALEDKIEERKKRIMEQDRLLRDKDPEVQKRAARIRIPEEPQPTYVVYPDSVVLKPRMGCMFTVRGESAVGGHIDENLVLSTKVGKEKKSTTVCQAAVSANFVNPLLHASVDVIEFCFTFNPDERMAPGTDMTQRRPLKLKNVSQLPLNFILRTHEPFSVDTWEIALDPEQETSVNVLFNPLLKSDDLKTQTLHEKLTATHQNHPQKDVWDIRAQINFPNLDFEYTELNFGCLLNDTSKTQRFRITNTSVIDTMYSWAFLEEDAGRTSRASTTGSSKRPLGLQNVVASRPEPNDVFDIRPIRGLLRPGESQEVEVSYFAHANQRFDVTAVCEVEGGPEYEVSLRGEASQIHYTLDQEGLDFGDLIHDTTEEQALMLANSGKVAFDFRIVSPDPDVVSCTPNEGRIFAKDTQKIIVRFSPKVPELVLQNVRIEIAHLEPLAFPVKGRGIFASATLSLPRAEDLALVVHENAAKQSAPSRAYGFSSPSAAGLGSPNGENDGDLSLGMLQPEVQEWLGLLAEAEELLQASGATEIDATTGLVEGIATKTGARPVSVAPAGSTSPSRGTGVGRDRPIGSAPARSSTQPLTPSTSSSSDRNSGSQTTGGSKGSKRTKGSKRAPRFDMAKVRVEAEANRLRFARFLHRVIDNIAMPHLERGPAENNVFTLARYVVELGNVVVGKSRKKVFRILNTSQMPLSFSVPKSAISGSSFSLEPAEVSKLAPNESVELQLQFSAKRDAALGPLEWSIPLDIVNGPPLEVMARANVTMPEVSIAPGDVLDFGRLLIGQCKVMSFQLKNTSPVPADWGIHLDKMAGQRGSDSRAIACVPMSGTLQPNERCNVEVTFTPREPRSYQSKLPIKVASNPRTQAIMCKGAATAIQLDVTSDLLEMRPTLPSEGDFALREFSIRNVSECDVEVYSVDFDEQHVKEEAILAAVLDSMGYANQMRSQPRKAGEPLQQSIVEQFAELQEEAGTGAEASTPEQSEEGAETNATEGDVKDAGLGDLEDVAETLQNAQANEGETAATGPSYRDRGLAMDILLLAPPNVPWKADLASLLGEKAGGRVPVLGLDAVVEQASAAGKIPLEVSAHYGLEHPELAEGGKPPKKTRPIEIEEVKLAVRHVIESPACAHGVVLAGLESKYLVQESENAFEELARAVKDAFNVPTVSTSSSLSTEDGTEESKESDNAPNDSEASASAFVSPQNVLRVVILDVQESSLASHLESIAEEEHKESDAEGVNASAEYFSNIDALKAIFVKRSSAGTDAGESVEESKEEESTEAEYAAENAASGAEDVPAWIETCLLGEDCLPFVSAAQRVEAWLPEPGTPRPADWDEHWIPIPGERVLEILERPTTRPRSAATSGPFRIKAILSKESLDTDGDDTPAEIEPDTDEAEKSAESDTDETMEEPKASVTEAPIRLVPGAPYRWVIPAGSTLKMQVILNACKQGTFEQQLSFQAVGSNQQYWVLTKGVCTVPTISADPRNVFMNRIKARPEHRLVSKKYVMSKALYEFGPLLVGKNPEECMQHEDLAVQMRNAETFRISNSGVLPVDEVRFVLVAGDGSFIDAQDSAATPFVVQPSEISLEPGETKDVRVWAFPQEESLASAKLVCCVKDNPEVYEFAMSCLGAKPQLAVHGPWEEVEEEEVADDSAQTEGEASRGDDAQEKQAALEFGRLLLGRQEERVFTVSNTSTIPVAWKLDLEAFADLPAFAVFPVEGTLAPGETSSISVQFNATEAAVHDLTLDVGFTDVEIGEPETRIQVAVRAEAYTIQVQPDFRQGDEEEDAVPAGIDFGMLRVFEAAERKLKLRNTGKYPVEFVFIMRKRLVASLIEITPMQQVLEADEEAELTLRFCSKNEAQLRNNKDIRCLIKEPATGETVESFEVPVDVCSVFSSFRVQPSKGIHFGAVKFEATPEKSFEIRNDGLFPFTYEIITTSELADRMQAQHDRIEAALREAEEKASRPQDEEVDAENDTPAETPPAPLPTAAELAAARASVELEELRALATPAQVAGAETLTVGLFDVTPRAGEISPGSSQELCVKFNADGDVLAQEALRILVSGRNPNDGTLMPSEVFELAGESHVPGINTDNYDSIFEEQGVVRSLDPTMHECGVFSKEENIFTFGAVIHTAVPAQGICERFKISNPNKIKAMVSFEVEARNTASEGIFSVHPEHLELPSHEHDFVSVYFKPSAINKYAAKFRALVTDGERKPETHLLEFDLQGEGTLPCLTVVEPSQLSDDAKFQVDLGRTQLRKSRSKEITVRNDGIVPATVRFDMDLHKSISFPLRNSSLTLQPQESRTTSVKFEPSEEGHVSAELLVRVLHNEFELSRFELSGEGYQEDMTFEELPGDADDSLDFGDVSLLPRAAGEKGGEDDGQIDEKVELEAAKSVRFCIKSNVDSVIRFEWDTAAVPQVTFSPSAGHVPPFGRLYIEAAIAASEPVSLTEATASLSMQRIIYGEDAFAAAGGRSISWNSNMTVAKPRSEDEEQNGGGDAAPESDAFQTAPEPAYTVVEGSETKSVALKCRAEVDTVRYALNEGQETTMHFRSTMMFQSRAFKFPVHNRGRMAMDIAWSIEAANGALRNSHCPFSISPAQARIAADSEQIFVVRFAPLEVEPFEYTAKAQIQNLCADQDELALTLSGMASRPVCHFELESSTYLERRKAPLPGLGPDVSVKVLEFQSLGLRIKNTKRFHVVNPTSMAYEFELVPIGEETSACFKCATSKGLIMPGKRCELSFSFTPTTVDLQESLWEFRIAEQGVSQTLLLVGTVSEPRVELSRKHVNFNSILVGGHSEETVLLENHEDVPFAFDFDSASFRDQENDIMQQLGGTDENTGGAARRARSVLRVEPMSGTVGPKSSLPLTVRFAPQGEKKHNFNLVCHVHRKPDKLSLNVKGEGSAIHDLLVMDATGAAHGAGAEQDASVRSSSGAEIELQHGERNLNELNFGLVHVNDNAKRVVTIRNRGKFSFDYLWTPPVELRDYDESGLLTLSPLRGTVRAGETAKCTFLFNPTREVALDNLRFQCTVAGARKYFVGVSGRGNKPLITFSSTKLDFGPCFVADPGARVPRVEEKTLVITNNETENPVAVDCTWLKTDFLDVVCEPSVLQPGERMEAVVRFSPRQLKMYPATIPFEINGLYTVNVLFSGEGTALHVELENSDDQKLHFGGLRVGQSATKTFALVNRSRRAVRLSLQDTEGRLEQACVRLAPAPGAILTLRPRESCSVTATFSPESRLSAFTVPVHLHVGGAERKLLAITGSCLAVDVKLELSNLSFGAVCESCQLARKIQVENAGDLGARFRWEMGSAARDNFSIFPMEGVLPPHAQLMVDVTFHPANLHADIRGDAKLYVEGNEQGMFPLSLSGSCIPQPEEGVSEVSFETKVRVPQTKSVEIKNPGKTTWMLRPTIHNSSWTGAERLEVPAGGSASYELVYRPLSMTGEIEGGGETKAPHEGSVFFALPTGQSLLFKLVGSASAPDAEDHVERSVAAKQAEAVPLKVENWCRTGQRMVVEIEKLSGPEDHFLRGASSLDIPGAASRDYKLTVIGYTQGRSEAKVTFTNTRTGEFLFYTVALTVEAPKTQETITLETSVRQTVSALIRIENPFFASETQAIFEPEGEKALFEHAKPSTTWWSCTSPTVRVRPVQAFQDCSEGVFEVQYRPLLATASQPEAGDEVTEGFEVHDLVLRSPQLGEYPYKLHLRASPAQTERSLQFRATLGGKHEQVFRFANFCPGATEFSCSVSQPLFFQVGASFKAEAVAHWRGEEVAVAVQFEPQGLGSVRDVLRVTSPDGGEYTCVLYGTCDPPRPQGPFVLEDASQSVSIEFKNVFNEAREFKFITDSDSFSVNGSRSQVVKLEAHKEITLSIKTSSSTSTTGKLLVTCVGQPDLPAWSYYLRAGKAPNSAR
ncbi:Hydrocephalus-inducing protein-like [Hondaea fermentalgiana]|uniref:Hydrocephalus-inducing protein-like n=1 Tax=Hondaea fermentalgiana TaxID=2315210 RepID=A0A2R5GSE6_9STRA|nr:Hydrocephalus-inducing protein-like [Hondaea fermentalgiana]|eukprot:GBG33770.1 Hydrocephalus-inducing protein-like [Hondaea fermentalgiana]